MVTGAGNPKVLFNTRERAVSGDFNRAQALAGSNIASILSAMFDAKADVDQFTGGYEATGTGLEAPLRGHVISGLRVRPDNGTVNLFVEPGVACLVDQSAPSGDDAKMAVVADPGVQVTGSLSLTAGSGGAIRIDVIECQRITSVLEVDNRDQFNNATGLFSAVQMDKVVAGRLAYRIRMGTPGSGFPGVVAGWLPLAVCAVPAAATTWDDVTIWDVRPLVSDRWNAPHDSPRSTHENVKAYGYTDTATVGAKKFYGEVEATFRSYRAGGRLGVNSSAVPGVNYFDLQLAANREAGFGGFSSGAWFYVYLVFPFALPRWARYSDAGLGTVRVPVGTRGIPTVSIKQPTFNGTPLISVATPTATGLLDAASQNAVCVLAGRADSTPEPQGITVDGHVCSHVNDDGFAINKNTVSTTVWAQWNLADNTTHPGNARAIYVRLYAEFVTAGALLFPVLGKVQVTGPDANTANFTTVAGKCSDTTLTATASQTIPRAIVVRVPLPHDFYNQYGSGRSFKLRWTYDPGGTFAATCTVQNQTMQVLGWELGP